MEILSETVSIFIESNPYNKLSKIDLCLTFKSLNEYNRKTDVFMQISTLYKIQRILNACFKSNIYGTYVGSPHSIANTHLNKNQYTPLTGDTESFELKSINSEGSINGDAN